MVIPFASLVQPNTAEVKKICDGLGNILLKACKDRDYAARVQTQLCDKLGAALDASNGTANSKQSIQAACNKGFSGLGAVCLGLRFLAQSPSAGPTPAEASQVVCSKLKSALTAALPSSGPPPVASASALFEGIGYVSSSGTVDLANAYALGMPAQLSIKSTSQDPKVQSMTITPSSPGAGVSYTGSSHD